LSEIINDVKKRPIAQATVVASAVASSPPAGGGVRGGHTIGVESSNYTIIKNTINYNNFKF